MIAGYPFVAVDNCKEALRYCQGVLGGEIVILRKQWKKVLNADLDLGGFLIKFADKQADKPMTKGDYVRVFLRIETEEKFRAIYEAFADGGRIHTAAYEAPFNGLLAIVADRNVVCWVLSHYRD